MPRLNVEATNPPKSVTTPPPKLIRMLLRSAPSSESTLQTPEQVSIFLFSSPASIEIISMVDSVDKLLKNIGRQCSSVLVSASTKTEEYCCDSKNLFNIIYCFSVNSTL